jgi:surface antigen
MPILWVIPRNQDAPMPSLARPAAALAAALIVAPVGAIEYGFLDQAALRYFNPQDVAMMEETIEAALDEAADGETRPWENPATGSSGEVTPLETYPRDDLTCRRARVVNRALRATDTAKGSVLDFCRIGGVWKIADVPRPRGPLTPPSTPENAATEDGTPAVR